MTGTSCTSSYHSYGGNKWYARGQTAEIPPCLQPDVINERRRGVGLGWGCNQIFQQGYRPLFNRSLAATSEPHFISLSRHTPPSPSTPPPSNGMSSGVQRWHKDRKKARCVTQKGVNLLICWSPVSDERASRRKRLHRGGGQRGVWQKGRQV